MSGKVDRSDLPSVLMSVVEYEDEAEVNDFDTILAPSAKRKKQSQRKPPRGNFEELLPSNTQKKEDLDLSKLQVSSKNSESSQQLRNSLSFSELEHQIKEESLQKHQESKGDDEKLPKVSSKKDIRRKSANVNKEELPRKKSSNLLSSKKKKRIFDDEELITAKDKVELINAVMNFFDTVDPGAPKHFVQTCLSLIEERGADAVDSFLKEKYGASPFSGAGGRGPSKSVSVDVSHSQKKPAVSSRSRRSAEEVRVKCRDLVSNKIAKCSGKTQLKSHLGVLLKLRDDVLGKDGKSGSSRGAENRVEDICSWSFKYGTHSLSGLLEVFYLGSIETPSQPSAFLESLPDVPHHGERLRKDFKKKLRELEKSIKPAAEAKVKVDESTQLDQGEIAHLWISAYKFYKENNFGKGKGKPRADIELVKQTENSIYYILQRGIPGFNQKLKEKYGDEMGDVTFSLPEQPQQHDDLVLEEVLAIYKSANHKMKLEMEQTGKKMSKRSFFKLIEALNFKFHSKAEKQRRESERVAKTTSKPASANMVIERQKSKPKTVRLPQVSNMFKKASKRKHSPKLLEKKIRLFLLQSMKTPSDQISRETVVLMRFFKQRGIRALSTRMRINYGGEFEYVDEMSENEIDSLLAKIEDMKSEGRTTNNVNKNPKALENTEQFLNIYKDLSFFRNPEAQIRYNKG